MLVRLFLNALFLVRAPWVFLKRRRALTSLGIVALEIDGSTAQFPEQPHWLKSWLVKEKKRRLSLHEILEFCEALSRDSRAQALYVHLKPISLGYGGAQQLRDALALLVQARKHVYVYLAHGAGMKEYFVASAADQIALPAHASLSLVGIGGKSTFWGALLRTMGVDVEVQARHEYKSAGEPFSQTELSPAARHNLQTLLGDLKTGLGDAMKARWLRKGLLNEAMSGDALFEQFTQGPYHAERAHSLGLVDQVCLEPVFKQHLIECLKNSAHTHQKAELAPPALDALIENSFGTACDYQRRHQTPYLFTIRRPKCVGVMPLHGVISEKRSLMASQAITLDETLALIQEAKESARIGAVTLHVNSPGGGAFASAEIFHALMDLRAHKPITAYFGDIAASGGYYIGCAASALVASPCSVVGSIGVVSMRPILDRLMQRFEIHRDGVTMGAHAGLLEMIAPWREAEQAAMNQEIDAIYAEFTHVVKSARNLNEQEIDQAARGRVFSGSGALTLRLVDRLGSWQDAVQQAAMLASLPQTRKPLLLKAKSQVNMSTLGLSAMSSVRFEWAAIVQLLDFTQPLCWYPFDIE